MDAISDLGSHCWERLPPNKGVGGATESAKAYEAFRHYRDLPAAIRSIRRTAQDLNKTKSLRRLETWSPTFYWSLRAAEWDKRRATLADQERERLQRAHVELWANRAQETVEQLYQEGNQWVAKGKEYRGIAALDSKVNHDGKEVTVRTSRAPLIGAKLTDTGMKLKLQALCLAGSLQQTDQRAEVGEVDALLPGKQEETPDQ